MLYEVITVRENVFLPHRIAGRTHKEAADDAPPVAAGARLRLKGAEDEHDFFGPVSLSGLEQLAHRNNFV